jgi:ribonuclease T2
MKSKNLIRLLLAIVVAVFGAWQVNQSNQGNPGPQNNPSPFPRNQSENRPQNNGKETSGRTEQTRSNRSGDFDYYLISLSWSPAYCATHPNDKGQCGGRGFGFVLHGLWPQKSSGGYPENCGVNSQPSAAVVQKTLAFMPSEKLIQHEWDKHGTCTGLSADEYLALADKAFGSINIPKSFQTPDRERQLTASEVVTEFAAANPAIKPDSIVVSCSRKELSEVRVCVDTQLKPTQCGKGVRSQCGTETVRVIPAR